MTKGARLRAVVVRAAKPYWTHLPASGDGAAKHGGRFNPIRVPALYTSFSFNTAAKEVRFSLNADPYTFYFLEVDSDRVADLSDAKVRKALKVDWSELESPNWESDMHKGVEPASHKLARRLIREGYTGIIVPSFAKGATSDDLNLVLWVWEDATGAAPKTESHVRVLKRDELPSDASSWRRKKPKGRRKR